jgi:hypothetical protein
MSKSSMCPKHVEGMRKAPGERRDDEQENIRTRVCGTGREEWAPEIGRLKRREQERFRGQGGEGLWPPPEVLCLSGLGARG